MYLGNVIYVGLYYIITLQCSVQKHKIRE